ncbi:MAG: metal ABC transporter ATP-binding protein, partial [Ignisphaera sp.]
LSKSKIVIATCHDPEMLLRYTDLVLLIGKGKYVADKPENVLVGNVLREFYGESIVEFANHIHVCDYHV